MQRTSRVWTGASTSTAVFVPLFSLKVNEVGSARLSYVMFSATDGDLRIRRSVRYSNDGYTWESPLDFEDTGYSAPTTFQWGGSYISPNTAKQHIQYGFRVINNANTTLDRATVSAILEVRTE